MDETPDEGPDDFPCIGVVFALPEESAPFYQSFLFPPGKSKKSLRAGEVAVSGFTIDEDVYSDIPVVLACSSVGVSNAARTTREALDEYPEIAVLFIVGFAGGLSDTAAPGGLIFANKVTDGTETFSPDASLFAAAEALDLSGIKIERGMLVTVDRVATTAAEKRELAKRTGAIAVDMETAGAVRVAEARGIPWLAVRAITDGVNDALPLDFNALANPDGSVNRGRVIRATLAQPHKIPALIRLGQRSSLAANNLAAFLVAFLQALPETE